VLGPIGVGGMGEASIAKPEHRNEDIELIDEIVLDFRRTVGLRGCPCMVR
jgi:hypothetical protein